VAAQVLSTQHTFHLAFATSVTQKQFLLCFYKARREETGADVMCDGCGLRILFTVTELMVVLCFSRRISWLYL